MADRPVLIADAITAITSFTADARTTALAPTPVPSMRRDRRGRCRRGGAVPLADVDVQHLRRPADGVGIERSASEQSRRRACGRAVDERREHVVGARRDRDDHRMRRADRHITAGAVATEHDDRHTAHRLQPGRTACRVQRRPRSLTVDQFTSGDPGERSFGDATGVPQHGNPLGTRVECSRRDPVHDADLRRGPTSGRRR